MSNTQLTASAYADLLSRIQGLLAEGRERARLAIEYERVKTYWDVGGELTNRLAGEDQVYGRQIFKNLAADLEIKERLLYEMVELRSAFPNLAPGPNLTWSHYRRLIRLPSHDERTFYLRRASSEEMSVRQLEAAIKQGGFAALAEPPETEDAAESGLKRLQAKRGEPYVYRVNDKPDGTLVLNLGFHTDHRLSTPVGLTSGQVVRSVRDASAPEGYRIEPIDQRRRLYAFGGTVARLIDGDTLWVTADCGFNTLRDVKVRLRGIDTPELGTAAGEAAKRFTANALASVRRFVIVTTSIDLYDRYLTDVFYLPGEDDIRVVAKEGRFLNRELVREGLARIWTEGAPPEF